MRINKGNAACHTFSKQGVENYESMAWNHQKAKCEHKRSIGKGRVVCLISESNVYCNGTNCPLGDNNS